MLTRRSTGYLLLVLPWLATTGCSSSSNNSDAAKYDTRPALDGSFDVTSEVTVLPDAGADAAGDAVAVPDSIGDVGVDVSTADGRDSVVVIDGRPDASLDEADARRDVSSERADVPERDGPAIDGPAIDGRGPDSRLDAAVDAPLTEVGGVDASPLELMAMLSGAEVVPPVTTTATAMAAFALQSDGATLSYHVTHKVANASAVTIYMGAAGTSGDQVATLTPVSGDMSGTVTLNANQVDSLESGMTYVAITSSAQPDGEVRGQILLPGQTLWVAKLTGGQEVPPVQSTASAQASFILSADQTTLRYHLTTSGLTPTGARFESGMAGMAATSIHQLTPFGTTMDGVIVITPAELQALTQEHLSADVTTNANPGGELRGQIILPGEILYSAVMSSSEEVPAPTNASAEGAAQFILNPSGNSMTYEAVWSGLSGPATASHIHTGAVGVAGPVLYPLQLNASGTGASGSLSVTPADVTALNVGQIYVNAHTAANPSGEVRGQLTKQ